MAVFEKSRCRCCFKKKKVYPHPRNYYGGKPSTCFNCIVAIKKSSNSPDCLCNVCGEGDIRLFHCYTQNCAKYFCLGCIAANYGKTATKNILKQINSKKWHCFACTPSFHNRCLDQIDLEYRGSFGGFTPKTFVPVTKLFSSFRKNDLFRLSKKPKNGPYNVISVVWFVDNSSLFGEKYLRLKKKSQVTAYVLGLARNVEALTKAFPEWRLRVYYDNSVMAAYPEIAPNIIKAFVKHPFVEVYQVPNWPEFKDNKGLYIGLIPTLFRLLVLDDDVDNVIIRDIDSVLSKQDFGVIDRFLKSKNIFHRYFCSDYEWPLLAGGIAIKVKKNKFYKTVAKNIYNFLVNHFIDPSQHKELIFTRERLFGRKKLLHHVDINDIGTYFIDQVFLEKEIFTQIADKDLMTTVICIQGVHKNYKPKSGVQKICNFCKITTMEYYLRPTFRPGWLNLYDRNKINYLKYYLSQFEWTEKYLFSQKINWNTKQCDPRIKRKTENYYKPVNLLKRNDFCINRPKLDSNFFLEETEFSSDDFDIKNCKIVKIFDAKKICENFGNMTSGIKKSLSLEIENKKRVEEATEYLDKNLNRKMTTRKMSNCKNIKINANKKPIFIDLCD